MRRLATGVAIVLLSALGASTVSAGPRVPALRLATPPAEYRAGSAASVFGPATAIGDFDADGQPDFAVADRLAGRGDVDYRVEVRLSGGAPQIFRFASPQHALVVTAIDIDHDHDLDLVFTPVVGRRIVGVWLNDGTGHFVRGKSRVSPADLERLTNVSASAVPSLGLPAAPTPRRLWSRRARHATLDEDAVAAVVTVHDVVSRRRTDRPGPESPRGPPAVA